MSKVKFTPRGPWQATGMQKLRIPKEDPRKLRMRAEELKLKAGRLVNEADELIARLSRSKLRIHVQQGQAVMFRVAQRFQRCGESGLNRTALAAEGPQGLKPIIKERTR